MRRLFKKSPASLKYIPLTETKLQSLQLCKAFTQRLVGKKLHEEATQCIMKSKAALAADQQAGECHFAVFCPGTIDYTPQHQITHTLIGAMEKKRSTN